MKQFKNKIFLSDEIRDESSLELIEILLEMDEERYEVIKLFINSNGGDLSSAFLIINVLKNLKTPVDSFISGQCNSSASLISTACRRKYIYKNSTVIIHQVSIITCTQCKNNLTDYETATNNLKTNQQILNEHYLEYTKITKENLEKYMNGKDITLTAKECLELGIIDEIV